MDKRIDINYNGISENKKLDDCLHNVLYGKGYNDEDVVVNIAGKIVKMET